MSETQKPILPHPRSAQYRRARKNQIPISLTYCTGPMGEPGHIYVMVNPSIEGLVKIGKTTRDPESRAKELSQATGVATPFYVAYSIVVADCDSAEEYVHAVVEYNGFKRSPNREFFEMPLRKAIEVLTLVERELGTQIRGKEYGIGTETEAAASIAAAKPAQKEHPAQTLMDRACDTYYGLGDEIEDKEEAVRLLLQAKKLNFPAAFTSLAWHYMEEADHAQIFEHNDAKAHALYDAAFEVLKQGAQKGHGRCYVKMAEMYMNGLRSAGWEADPQSAVKCWKKYFRSDTFINDDDQRYNDPLHGLNEHALDVGNDGAPRDWHAHMYLFFCFLGRLYFDGEIGNIILPLRDQILLDIQESVASAEQELARKPRVLSGVKQDKSGNVFARLLRGNRDSSAPKKDKEERHLEERHLEEQRRFYEYVYSLFSNYAS